MLKSSKVLAVSKPASPPRTPRGLRKAYSSESLVSSPRPQLRQLSEDNDLFRPPQMSSYDLDGPMTAPGSPGRSTHGRGKSVDGRVSTHQKAASTASVSAPKVKDKNAKNTTNTPSRFCNLLTSTSSMQLDVETIKKLRLLLRNEPARCVTLIR